MSESWRLVVFDGRKSLVFAQTAQNCFNKNSVELNAVGMGAHAAADATVSKKDILVFPVFSDVRIPKVVLDQVYATQPSTIVRVAVIGDFAAETDFGHMQPLVGEVVRIVRERGGHVESPVLLIDYEAVTNSEIVGGWALGLGVMASVDGVQSFKFISSRQVCGGPSLESLSVVQDCVGADIRYDCNADGNCIGLSVLTSDEYPKSLWPKNYLLKKSCLAKSIAFIL